MASTYVNDLRLNEMATGDGSGTWGTTTNTNLELIAEAFSYGTEAITTNADTHTTTIADGATDPGRSMYLKYTGTLDSACTITIGPNTVSKVWIIENGTSGSQNIIISQGSGADITIPAGDTKVVYSDGAGAGAAFFDAFASLSVVDLKVQDDLTVTDAALVTGVLTTTATQVATGGITSGSDIISDTDSTDSLGSTGVRWLKGWFDTLTAGTLTVGSGSVTDSSGAISFGDENLTTTGIVTAAGTSVFTNLDISGDIDVDGTTNLDVVDIDGALTQDGGAVFNEASADVDFRVESDNDANALFVQGSDGFVGIGTDSPATKLQVNFGDAGGNLVNLVGDGATAGTAIATNWTTGNAYFDLRLGGTTDTYTVMRVTNGGNVGIGASTVDAKLHIEVSSGDANLKLEDGSATYMLLDQNSIGGSDVIRFKTGGSLDERMRIASGGAVSINTTSTGGTLNVLATGSDTSNWCQRYFTTGTTSELYVVDFIDYQGQRVGYITNNPVGNTTAYVTSSDYRLKENVDYTWDATTRLKQLKPARFNWIRDESNTLVDGFLAHEVEDIVPEAISGEKDATETKTNAVVNSYGNYIADNVTEEEWLAGKEDGTYDADTTWAAFHTQDFYQCIDQAKLVPLLVKTIQELEARITTLENA
jgi:hypothetical protein